MTDLNAGLFTPGSFRGLVLGGLMLVTTLAIAQDDIPQTNDSPLYRGEQMMLNGSYAAASEIFKMADGLDRADGLIGASKALAMMGNYQEAESGGGRH